MTGTNTKYVSYPNKEGDFSFVSIPDGTYLLEIYDYSNYYEPVLVEVADSKDVKARAFIYDIRIGKG